MTSNNAKKFTNLPNDVQALVYAQLHGRNAARAAATSKHARSLVNRRGIPTGAASYLKGTAKQQKVYRKMGYQQAWRYRRAFQAAMDDAPNASAPSIVIMVDSKQRLALIRRSKKSLRAGTLVHDAQAWADPDYVHAFTPIWEALWPTISLADRQDPERIMDAIVTFMK